MIGDYVSVKNPKPDQQDRGAVFRATMWALVRIRTQNGEEVKRLYKNLVLILSADDCERSERGYTGSAAAAGQ